MLLAFMPLKTKLVFRQIACATLAWLLMATTGLAGQLSAFEPQKAAERLVAAGAPGALVQVHAGDTTFTAEAGFADRATRRHMDSANAWRIASVTKMVTAVVLMQLVDEGRLQLTDTVGRYVPQALPRIAGLKIDDLLHQTTGLPEYLTVGDDIFSARAITRLLARRPSQALLVDRAVAGPWRRPGGRHDYANTNYVVLQQVIEAIDRQPLEASVQARVLQPLALTSTGFVTPKGQLPPGSVRAYLPLDGRRGPLTDYSRFVDVTVHPYVTGADGGLYATAAELDKLLAALMTGQLVSAEAYRAMTSELRPSRDGRYRYGYGVMAYDLPCGVRVFGHEGRDIGLTTLAFWEPASGRRFVLTVNTIPDGNDVLEKTITDIRNDAFCARRVGPPARGS